MSEKKDKEEELINAGIAGASYETVQRYGSANKEHLAAYSGKLQKNLKSIHAQKTNVNNEFSIKQQKSGWSAEVADTANTNSGKIINGDTTRKIRYDDLPNTPSNNPLYDHVTIDAKGNIIAGSGTQMKVLGSSKMDPNGVGNAERALDALQSKKFQKYIDNNVKIEVPKDEYPQTIKLADEKIVSLENQLEKAKAAGNKDVVFKLEKKIDNLNKLKKNTAPMSITRKDINLAQEHPALYTAKKVIDVSHNAGLQAAKNAAIVGGGISLVKNLVSMYKSDIEVSDGVKNSVKDMAKSAVTGYITGFVGSALKGAMQNSKSKYISSLSKTNIAATIVSATITVTKTLARYFNGEINGLECMEALGEQGTGMIASAMFAAIGQAAIPIPVIGGLIGGMIGYVLSSASYGILTSSLREAKLAREERIAIEKACEEHIKMIREYRAEMNAIIEEHLSATMGMFNESFSGIKDALKIGDVDWVIDSANNITESLGGNKPFETMDEFNEKMLNKTTFKL